MIHYAQDRLTAVPHREERSSEWTMVRFIWEVAVRRRGVAGGGGVTVLRWRRVGGGLGAKAPSCSSAWSARAPTL